MMEFHKLQQIVESKEVYKNVLRPDANYVMIASTRDSKVCNRVNYLLWPREEKHIVTHTASERIKFYRRDHCVIVQ